VIKSKICSFCISAKRKFPDKQVEVHECWKNHEGSSGSMESSSALQVLVEAFEKQKVVIRRLCCDDDSSIRADCQWSNADYLKNNNTRDLPMVKKKHGKNKDVLQPRPDKGKLPGHVPEPLFVADPNHRRKGLTGELIKLDTSKADIKCTMTRMDSTRIGKNFGYMARTLKDRPECEFVDAAKACLEHHFDNHIYCGAWCKRKYATEEERKTLVKYYRNKETDAKLYTLIQSKMERFVTKDRLMEMAHGLDTNMNEAFNQICTWFAPKNKVFAGSGSLRNRIAMAVGVHSLGVEVFFKRLFKNLGIPVSDSLEYYLRTKEKNRMKRLSIIRTKAAKLKKNKRKFEKLHEATQQAKKEYHKRQGTYRKGMNLDDPFGELCNGKADDERKPPAKKKSKKGSENFFCEYCGGSDHLTKRSKKCTAEINAGKRFRREDGSLLSEPRIIVEDAATFDELQDCDRMDSLPFDVEYNSDNDVEQAMNEAWMHDDDGAENGVVDGSEGIAFGFI
jgi:hypothetical protein